jgi:hypothetical protein
LKRLPTECDDAMARTEVYLQLFAGICRRRACNAPQRPPAACPGHFPRRHLRVAKNPPDGTFGGKRQPRLGANGGEAKRRATARLASSAPLAVAPSLPGSARGERAGAPLLTGRVAQRPGSFGLGRDSRPPPALPGHHLPRPRPIACFHGPGRGEPFRPQRRGGLPGQYPHATTGPGKCPLERLRFRGSSCVLRARPAARSVFGDTRARGPAVLALPPG